MTLDSLLRSLNLSPVFVKRAAAFVVAIVCLYYMFRKRRTSGGDNQAPRARRPPTQRGSNPSTRQKNISPVEKYLVPSSQRHKICLSVKSVFTSYPNMDIPPKVASLLISLVDSCDIFLISLCEKEEEENIRSAVTSLLGPSYPIHRLLFCSTQKGKGAMVRHIEPSLYLEDNPVVLAELKRHVPDTALVDPTAANPSKLGHTIIPSLSQYFFVETPTPTRTKANPTSSSPLSSPAQNISIATKKNE